MAARKKAKAEKATKKAGKKKKCSLGHKFESM